MTGVAGVGRAMNAGLCRPVEAGMRRCPRCLAVYEEPARFCPDDGGRLQALVVRRPGRLVAVLVVGVALGVVAGVGGARHHLERRAAVGEGEGAAAGAGMGAMPERVRAVVVADQGYSLRVLLPEQIAAGEVQPVSVELWDADGEPLSESALVVTIEDGGGARGVAARPTGAGRYLFRHEFARGGRHVMRVFAPGGDASIQVFFDVSDAEPAGEPRA